MLGLLMTRADAINSITTKLAELAELDDEGLNTLVEIATSLSEPISEFRFTPAERAAIERSREDFRAGRTFSHDEAVAYTDAALAARRASRTKT